MPKFEDISLGQRLLELGLATVNEEIPKTQTQMNWWMPWILDPTPPAQLFRAQNKAINYRAGIWQEKIPPSKFQILQKYIKKVLPPSKNVPSVL